MKKTFAIIGGIILFALIGKLFTSCGEEKKTYDEIINEAIAANDYQTCDSVLIEIKDRCDRAWPLHDKYIPRAMKVIKAQADYLIETDDADVQKMFLKLLNDFNLVFGYYDTVDGHDGGGNDNGFYSSDVTNYNNFCLVTVNQCLINDKPDLARKIAKFIREDLNEGEDEIYHFTTETKDKAAQAIANYEAEQN